MKNKFYIDYKEIIDLSSIGLKPKFNFVFDIGSYIEVDLNKMTYFHTPTYQWLYTDAPKLTSLEELKLIIRSKKLNKFFHNEI